MRLLKLIAVTATALAAIALIFFGALASRERLASPVRPAARPPIRPVDDRLEERYLELLKLYLTRQDFGRPQYAGVGTDFPKTAETMLTLARLDNLHGCIRDVLEKRVPGDLIECGAWRGGATIFMRAALRAYGDQDRNVWVADSFEGLPKPDDSRYPADKGSQFWNARALAVSLEEVRENFVRYGLLDARVRFLKGWFKDTLPVAPIGRLAILRADGDMYESTMQILEPLYDKVSPGGYVIVDDYYAVAACRQATDDFRRRRNITGPMVRIDAAGVYWRKELTAAPEGR